MTTPERFRILPALGAAGAACAVAPLLARCGGNPTKSPRPPGEGARRLYTPIGDPLTPRPGLAGGAGSSDDEPAPNLDGTRIAFMSDRSGPNDIWLGTRGGTAATTPALASGGNDIEPALSSNGR